VRIALGPATKAAQFARSLRAKGGTYEAVIIFKHFHANNLKLQLRRRHFPCLFVYYYVHYKMSPVWG